jgi:hypothetical protein
MLPMYELSTLYGRVSLALTSNTGAFHGSAALPASAEATNPVLRALKPMRAAFTLGYDDVSEAEGTDGPVRANTLRVSDEELTNGFSIDRVCQSPRVVSSCYTKKYSVVGKSEAQMPQHIHMHS